LFAMGPAVMSLFGTCPLLPARRWAPPMQDMERTTMRAVAG